MSTNTLIDIQGCADLAKDQGKKLSYCRFWLRWFTFFATIIFTFFNFAWWQVSLALLSEVFGSSLEGWSKVWFSRHRKWRAAGLICDSFGTSVSPELQSEIEFKLGIKGLEKVKEQKRSEDKPYYTSKLQHGMQRLMENVRESVHFSARISQASHRKLLFWPFISALFVLGLFVFAPQIDQSHWAGLSLVMTFVILISSDNVKNYFEYRKAESEFRAVEVFAGKVANNPQLTSEVLQVLADYVLISAMNPPLDSGLFKKMNHSLQASWASQS